MPKCYLLAERKRHRVQENAIPYECPLVIKNSRLAPLDIYYNIIPKIAKPYQNTKRTNPQKYRNYIFAALESDAYPKGSKVTKKSP